MRLEFPTDMRLYSQIVEGGERPTSNVGLGTGEAGKGLPALTWRDGQAGMPDLPGAGLESVSRPTGRVAKGEDCVG